MAGSIAWGSLQGSKQAPLEHLPCLDRFAVIAAQPVVGCLQVGAASAVAGLDGLQFVLEICDLLGKIQTHSGLPAAVKSFLLGGMDQIVKSIDLSLKVIGLCCVACQQVATLPFLTRASRVVCLFRPEALAQRDRCGCVLREKSRIQNEPIHRAGKSLC